MIILAIETSCDETAAAVVTDGRDIMSNVLSSQIDVHAVTGGIVPEVSARLQLETILPVITKALEDAGVDWDGIDAIAVTSGPGLMGSLIVGTETAKALAFAKKKPLIGVNHLAGHVYACFSEGNRAQGQSLGTFAFTFPSLALVVSGGHTELVRMDGHHSFTMLGSTRDDAAGEAFDKVGRMLGMDYPAGPAISALAEEGKADAVDFPRPMLAQDNLDFSFSGLKTAVRQAIEVEPMNESRRADMAASFEAAVVDTLVGKTRQAISLENPKALLIGGGVAANNRLREHLTALAEETGVTLYLSPSGLTTDNAAMIGIAAYWDKERSVKDFSVFADAGAELST